MSILITSQKVHKFQDDFNTSLGQISVRFQVNSLFLNLSKTCFFQFSSKDLKYFDINITHGNNHIPKLNDKKFGGLNINNTLSWKIHINEILPKLCSACFAMRSVKPFVSQHMLKVIYYSYFHSIMSYGIIFWGHSASSLRVFRLQKRIIRIMMGCKSRDSLFTKIKILTMPSLYIFSVLLFVVKNKELFTTNTEVHNFYTRQHINLHQPTPNLSKYQIGVLCMSIKKYNSLPAYIKHEFNNYKKLESLLKKFLCENSFYSLEEFFSFPKSK